MSRLHAQAHRSAAVPYIRVPESFVLNSLFLCWATVKCYRLSVCQKLQQRVFIVLTVLVFYSCLHFLHVFYSWWQHFLNSFWQERFFLVFGTPGTRFGLTWPQPRYQHPKPVPAFRSLKMAFAGHLQRDSDKGFGGLSFWWFLGFPTLAPRDAQPSGLCGPLFCSFWHNCV